MNGDRMSDSVSGRWRKLLITLVALVALLPVSSAAAADCGCTTTGAYKAPSVTAPEIDGDGTSPNGVYKLTATGPGSAPNITIKRQSTGVTVYSSTLPGGSTWGFSPDDDRFVYHYLTGGVETVVLLNLTKTGSNKQVWTTSVTTGSSRFSFSPGGKYLLYTYRYGFSGASTTNLIAVDAQTGAVAHETSFLTQSPPGSPGDSFGVASWGFSPGDGALVYGYVNGANSVSLNLINLSTRVNVMSMNLTGISAFWRFSPCGEVLGLVHQTSQSFLEASTHRVSNGSTLGSAGGIPLGAATLSSTLVQHQVTVNGTIHPLGSNTADNACATPTVLDALVIAPTAVVGGAQNPTATATLNHAPPSSLAITLSSSDTSVATVPASVSTTAATKTFTVTSKPVTTQKTTVITATAGGVSKTVTLTVNPPAAAPALASFTLNPTSVQGGNQSTGTVTLDRPAASGGGTRVNLSSSNPNGGVPASVLIASGDSDATFTVATNVVLNTTTVPITATLGSTSLVRNLTVTAAPVTANAVNRDPACTAGVLPANDDGSTGVLNLGFTVNYFGTEYDQLWLNNNGNVTFDGPLGTYTPFNLTSTNQVIIAPFFADVDTRGFGSGLTTWGSTTVGGRPAFCANWTGVNFDGVGYYAGRVDKRNTFQLLLIDRSDTGAGNFDIQFNYDKIQWETGDASSGSGGLGGFSARAGYSNGDPANPQASLELPGSAINGAFLDTSATGLTRSNRNSTVLGRYAFEVRNGAPPTGGRITGQVLDDDGDPVSGSQVQVCRDGTCVRGRSNSQGNYTVSGLENGDYTATAYPPAGSSLSTGTIGPLSIPDASTVLTGRNIVLTGPSGPPPGTSISPSSGNGQGIPTVYWHDPLTLVTHGCPGGAATYTLAIGASTISSGAMTEGPAGTYTVTIPPLAPNHGNAHIHIALDCPGATPDETRDFDIYIDPSGTVRTVEGDVIPGATVTLYRADTPDGTFERVPDGSDIMSPNNRTNPDTTDEAGHFGWDVIAGYYKVRARAEGCVNPDDPSVEYVDTEVLTIPPPVTNLDLRLSCPQAAPPETTPPVISLASPADTVYALGSTVNAHFTCSDADSGIASCSGTVNDGVPIDTSSVGVKTFTVTATDNAGNPASETRSYRVVAPTAGRMTAKGSFGAFYFATLTSCVPGAAGNTIQGQSGANVFKLTSVSQVVCFRDAAAPYQPSAGFTTQVGAGTGTWNNVPGYTIAWTLLDGATGADERVTMVITSPLGVKVVDVSGAPGRFPGASQTTGLVTAGR